MSSMSSRPSSSLSQQSSCTGDEQHERQVSHDELEKFEAASLRGSLPRRCCRDSRASSHFAINPLLHLESASDRSRHGDGERAENLVGNDVQTIYPEERERAEEDARDDRGSKNSSNVGIIFERKENSYVLEENREIGTDSPRDWNRDDREGSMNREGEEPIVPRYDNRAGSPNDRDDRDPGDRDSGMCSIGSRDSESSERDRWRRLYRVTDNDRPGSNGSISSVGGRKFWTTGGDKYHTFGGIKIRPKKTEDLDDDFEDESTEDPIENPVENYTPEFARLKFQTFGGIKRSRKVDSRRIPNYRRIRLRPILPEAASVVRGAEDGRDFVETEGSANLHSNSENRDQPTNLNRSTNLEGFASFEHSTSSTFEESDWQDEESSVMNGRISYAQIGRSRNRTSAVGMSPMTKRRNQLRKKNVNSSSLRSLPNEDDEWEDEIDCASDEIIMNKFLKDVSRRRKAYVLNDDYVAAREGGMRSGHREILENINSEKLKKSITGDTERNLESPKKSRQEEKGDDKRREVACEKLRVRSLSDVTMW